MAKHKNSMEKEFLIRQHKNRNLKLKDFCERNKEMYKREILKLRIENERLKKLYSTDERSWEAGVCSLISMGKTIPLRKPNTNQ